MTEINQKIIDAVKLGKTIKEISKYTGGDRFASRWCSRDDSSGY